MGNSASAAGFLAAVARRLDDEQAAAARAPYGMVRVAAYVFAICEYLREAHYDSSMDSERPRHPPAAGLGQVGALSVRDAYGVLLEWLRRYEAELEWWRDDGRMPESTTLVPAIEDGAGPAVHGIVHHWLRSSPAWTELRDFRTDAMQLEGGNNDPLRVVEHLRHLVLVWQRDGRTIGPLPRHRSLRMLVRGAGPRLRDRSLRIALCPLPQDLPLRFTIRPDGEYFTVRRDPADAPRADLRSHIDLLLADAAREQIHVLVLPELCVDDDARAHLAGSLTARVPAYPWVVIAGSYHFWRGESADPVNEAIVVGRHGPSDWIHHKRGLFKLSRADAQAAIHAGLFDPPPAGVELAPEVKEAIVGGAGLSVCETTLGRLAIVICADALRAEGTWPLIERLRPDALFIVSMSPKTDPFFSHAVDDLLRARISTFYVNARLVVPPDGKPDRLLAFATLAVPEGPATPPSRIRWQNNLAPEWYDFNKKAWRALTELGGRESGFHLLPDGRGLVITLGEQWLPLASAVSVR